MLTLGLGINKIFYVNNLTPAQSAYKTRVEEDGGTVESIECVKI